MPRTPPPLIIPNNIPSSWVNRSKVSKKKTTASNIYAAQNKQISFDDVDEFHFISSFNRPDSCSTDLNDVNSSIIAIDEMQTRTMSASVSTNQQTHQSTQKQQQQQIQQEQQSQTSLSHLNSTMPNTQDTVRISSSSSGNNNEGRLQQQQKATDTQEQNVIYENKLSAMDFLAPSSQQFESLVSLSQDLAADFQTFMEEYREIKKSIEDKKKELVQFTEERLHYLSQRQAHFQKELSSLQGFI